MKLLLFIIIFNFSFALPRFAVNNGTNCGLCHINPTGGALRNDHGSNVVALDELPLSRWLDEGAEDWDGFVGDNLQIGGDFRLQGIQYNATDSSRKTAFFPMQAEVYGFLELHEKAGVFAELGVVKNNQISWEYWALLNILPKNGWLRLGKTLPNYGLKVDDHTSFIRGGNLSKTATGKLDSEGLLFTPTLPPPAIFEIGLLLIDGLRLTSSISTSLLKNGGEELNNFTAQLNYAKSFASFSPMLSLNLMQEGEFLMTGISGGLNYAKFTWTFEADQAENWIDGSRSIALYDEIAWVVIQGVQLIGKYDYFDPDSDWQTGAISRYTLGAEIYPLNILEIKLQARFNKVDLENDYEPDPEYLIQTHFWF